MKLARFLDEHINDILVEWDAFALTLSPASDKMSHRALRDHAEEILRDITIDIESWQSSREQQEKSQGLALPAAGAKSAASKHGRLRHGSEFSLLQLNSEFRALRATVLRLWLPRISHMSADAADEMVRFNEAIDQALAESIESFSAATDRAREIFLAIIGHDLRAPLSTMALSGDLLAHPHVPPGQLTEIGARVRRSANVMGGMLDDLLEYTRTQLGHRIPIKRVPVEIGSICKAAIEDVTATHPASRFELDTHGDLAGEFDGVKLHQVLTNLLVNAVRYGGQERPIVVDAQGAPDAVTIAVTNFGRPIREESLPAIFNPLVQFAADDPSVVRPKTSLGLGLFVAREIAVAHGGSLAVTSDAVNGTTFTVRLPRTEAAQ